MKILTKEELEIAVQMIQLQYGERYANTSEELAKLVADEFECIVEPKEVEHFIKEYLPEQEDTNLLLKNIYSY